jgi:hypothetical protein
MVRVTTPELVNVPVDPAAGGAPRKDAEASLRHGQSDHESVFGSCSADLKPDNRFVLVLHPGALQVCTALMQC